MRSKFVMFMMSVLFVFTSVSAFANNGNGGNPVQNQTTVNYHQQNVNMNQGQGQEQKSYNKNTNNNVNRNSNINRNSNVNRNANLNLNAVQSNVKGTVKNTVSNDTAVNNGQVVAPSQVYNEAAQPLAAPEINPFYLTPMQGGKIGDCTTTMPKFQNKSLTRLSSNDVVVKVLDVYFGNPFSRITYEEVESYLIEKANKYNGKKGNIRYTVKFQDSVITSGVGGGGAVSDTSQSGFTSSTGSILPGVSRSTMNPIFIITFYEVEIVK